MKSEKAKEEIEHYRRYLKSCLPTYEIGEYCRIFKEIAELAEQEAEERMREELTRWHDPEEKLPEDDKDVLCMTDRQSNTYEVMRHDKHGWWVHVPIPEGGWCACDCNVIRWREIHENE